MFGLDTALTLASVPAILAVVNLVKRLTPRLGAWAALLAALLGVAFSLAQWAWAAEEWWSAASHGLLLGLAAAGLYDLTPGSEPRRAVEEAL